MKTKFEEIRAKLENAAEAKADKERKYNVEIREAERKSAELERALQDPTKEITPEEYKKLLREKSDNESYIDFLKKKRATERGPAISNEAYKEIERQVNAEVAALQADAAPEIAKAFENLVSLLDEYAQQVEEVDAIKNRAIYLNQGISTEESSAPKIATLCNDPYFNNAQLLRAYFNHRWHLHELAQEVSRGHVNPWRSYEDLQIAKAMKAPAGAPETIRKRGRPAKVI